MILAAVDDLMFASKIAAAARTLGVDVRFVRSSAALLEQARADLPTLVILDLNSAATQPIPTITALKADKGLAGIRTIGFVSHVQADLIASARAAGIDEVLARSAFASRIADVLQG